MVDHSAAGKNHSQLVWRQSDREALPIYQVDADGMTPVHRAPVIAVWVVLCKEVPAPFAVDKAVWVVDPVGLRGEMKLRAVLFRHGVFSFSDFVNR